MISAAPGIHPTSVVAPGARIAASAVIGPFCVIGPDVEIGEAVHLASHVSVTGVTSIGPRTQVKPFCSLGTPPQSTGYKGEPTQLIIGADNDLRENVTINTGTVAGGGVTRVGDGGMFMVGTHIGHDCIVGNRVIFANCATLGGHCVIGDGVVIGGLAACHQQTRVGEGAMIGAVVGLRGDVIPFCLVDRHGELAGINVVGMRRRGASKADLQQIRQLLRDLFFGPGSFEARKEAVLALKPDNRYARLIVDFIAAGGKRPLLKFGRGAPAAVDGE
jgi:UDP-N-acetylglucosamine acyltransferase